MKLCEEIPQAKVADHLGISRQGLNRWIAKYVRAPIERAGLEPPVSITLQDIWAVCIARIVKANGEPSEVAHSVFEFLSEINSQCLESAFSQGRTCVFVVRHNFAPILFEPEATRCGEVMELLRTAEREGLVVSSLRIDVKPMLDQLIQLSQG